MVDMRWMILCVSLLVAGWLFPAARAQQDPQNMVSYDEKFITGVKKYALEKWSDAIIYIRYI